MRILVAVVAAAAALVVLPLLGQEGSAAGQPALLARAAHANDFTSFDALYRAQPVEAFRPLHELWTYSVTDPGGAFYGEEMHQRFARAFPSYATAIAPYRIVDSHGNVFYPSRETRTFLLEQAEAGKRATLPPSASVKPVTRPVAASTPAPATKSPAPTARPRSPRKTFTKASLTAPPIRAAGTNEASLALASVVTVPAHRDAQIALPAQPAVAQDNTSGRGLLLVIVGVIGTGVLALIVRASPEVPSTRNS